MCHLTLLAYQRTADNRINRNNRLVQNVSVETAWDPERLIWERMGLCFSWTAVNVRRTKRSIWRKLGDCSVCMGLRIALYMYIVCITDYQMTRIHRFDIIELQIESIKFKDETL